MTALPRVHLRSLAEEDVPLVETWIRAEHVRRWWLEQEGALSDLHDTSRGRLKWIICEGDEAVGYLHVERVNRADWASIGLDVPDGGLDIDILIGVASKCGKGIGSAAVGRLVEALGAETYLATTSVSNTASRGAFTKNGFVVTQEFDEAGAGRMILLVRSAWLPASA